jgi:adenylate kinase family enzyme
MLQRIHIIGGPGSGKSYIARQLSQHCRIPAYDLDELFWDRAALRYGVRAETGERDAHLLAITQGERWIIEGVYYGWLRPSFEQADRIFVLRVNVFLRDWRIVKRYVSRKFGVRPTKRENLLDLYELLQWNHRFDTGHLQQALKFMQEFEDKIVECRHTAALLNQVIYSGLHN